MARVMQTGKEATMSRTMTFVTILATCVATTEAVGSSTVVETIDCVSSDKAHVRPELSFGLDQVASAAGFDFEHWTWNAKTHALAKEMAIWICHLGKQIRSVDLIAEGNEFALHWQR